MAHATHPNIEDVTLPEVMNAMSDPIRLGLIKLLSDGEERAWGQLDAPVAPSTLSYHLKILRSAGITRTRMEGTRLRSKDLNARFPGLLDTTVRLATNSDSGLTEIGLKEE